MTTSPTHSSSCPMNLTTENPHRRPDWRWQRASWRIATGSRRGERHDDEWTRRAVRCQKGHRRVACGRRPCRPQPDVQYAFDLCRKPDWLRAELEARILADQPVGEISSTTGVPERVISAFEAMFFDVRTRLAMGGWIVHDCIGMEPGQPLPRQDVKRAWKYFGFLHGAITVDALVTGVERADLEMIGLPACWSTASRLPKELQLLLLSQSLPQHGHMALKSLTRFVGMGLCESPPLVESPPASLALDLSIDIDDLSALWPEESEPPDWFIDTCFERAA